MKPAGYLLLVPAGFACLAMADETPAGLVSVTTKNHIREGLPVFQPKPPDGDAEAREPDATAADPTLLVLPKLTVKEKRLPADAARHLGNPRDFDRKMENLYLDEVAAVGRLNYFLNCFTIPILSPSKAARGKAIQTSRELDRLSALMSLDEAKTLNDFYDELAGTAGSRTSGRR